MVLKKFPNIVGLSVDEAIAAFPTIKVRVVNIDGKSQIVKMDAIANRLNVIVAKGKITKIKGWG